MIRPRVVDLFAGVGGLSLGFEQAGFDPVAAVEIDPVHAGVHKYNFPDCAVLPRSVVGLSGKEIREACSLGRKKVHVVVGGAPCQGFSLIGQRALDDPRNALVREFVRLVRELEADYFVFENVKGLTVGRHRSFLLELISLFESIGYDVQSPWRVLNAMHFGVPQDRERLFLIGARNGHRLPRYPEPKTLSVGAQEILVPLRVTPTCFDALSDLPNADLFDQLWDGDSVLTSSWGELSGYGRSLRCVDDSGWHFGYRRDWNSWLLTSSAQTNHTAISRRRFAATPEGAVEPISRFYKLSRHGVCNTLRAGTDAARGAFTSPRPIHFEYSRCITVREMARLHGYPDWFRFHVTKWHGARQIGNSVPPPLARAVANSISEAMGFNPAVPKNVFPRSSEELLRLDMSTASCFWGIQAPIARRDRKSGARKRKQEEIEALRNVA